MPTKALIGKGAVYAIHNGETPGAYVDIQEVADFPTMPTPTSDEDETTHHGSPGRNREFIATLIDNGELVTQLHWVPGDDEDVMLQGLMDSGEIRSHKITFVNDAILTVEGFVKTYAPVLPLPTKMLLNLTVRITGEMVWS
jgi:hypothetical protein